MIRACQLAKENAIPTEVRAFTITDLISAREVLITGTSLNVLPVVQFEENIIGAGTPRPHRKKTQRTHASRYQIRPELRVRHQKALKLPL